MFTFSILSELNKKVFKSSSNNNHNMQLKYKIVKLVKMHKEKKKNNFQIIELIEVTQFFIEKDRIMNIICTPFNVHSLTMQLIKINNILLNREIINKPITTRIDINNSITIRI